MSTAESDVQLAAARTAWEQNRVADAEAGLEDIVRKDPRHADAAMLLAEVLRSQGRLDAASTVVLAVCRANAFAPALCLRGVRFVQQCDRHAIAAAICLGALAGGADAPADLLVLAGHIARESGDFETARARYHEALDAGVDLERNQVLAALANTRRYVDPADPDIARCDRHFRDPAHSARSRASAGFALAKIRNDLGDYAAAAQVLRSANAMVRSVQPWSAAAWRSFVDARGQESVALPREPDGVRDFAPVFIVGVPRSGTTLTATLLARTTGARDRGELRTLRYIGERLVGGGLLGSVSAMREAVQFYRRLAVQDDAPATWYLDQDPLNFRWLHVAAAMFPKARVIHLRRDGRDTALSLWSQDFAHPDLAFAYDFGDIARFLAGHDALMAHWHSCLSIPILELDYEALVADPAGMVAALCDFIGAAAGSPEPGEAGTAPVQSASVWQARQPVYSTSVGRWRNYAPHVPELARFG